MNAEKSKKPESAWDIQGIIDQMMIVASRCNGIIPQSYLAFDVETSGLDHGYDRVIQYGWCWVTNHQSAEPVTVTVRHPKGVLSKKIVEITGLQQVDLDRGEWPLEAIRRMHHAIVRARAAGIPIVGHNAFAFDSHWITAEIKYEQKSLFEWHPNDIIDTGLIVKAAQLGLVIEDEETLADYWHRVQGVRARGVYWSLDGFCVSRFGLDAMLDRAKLHDAGYDSWLTAMLFESFKGCWYARTDTGMSIED